MRCSLFCVTANLSTLLSCTNFHALKIYFPDKTLLNDVLHGGPHKKNNCFSKTGLWYILNERVK